MSRSVKVSVAGCLLSVRTEARAAYLEELAAFVTEKVDEARRSGRTVSTQSVALLAAMNIADELYQERESQKRLKRQLRDSSRRIIECIDRCLDHDAEQDTRRANSAGQEPGR